MLSKFRNAISRLYLGAQAVCGAVLLPATGGTRAASVSKDGTCRLWEVRAPIMTFSFRVPPPPRLF